MSEDHARRVDVADLPDDVVGIIDALAPGDGIVVTRNGQPIAAIINTCAPPVARDNPPPDNDRVTVVATAMKLSKSARARLSAELGADYIVVDMHTAPPTTDVLLMPPSSPQLIGRLGSRFPNARVIITEIEDEELGIRYEGPVGRMLDAGAETYLPPTTIPRLATQLDQAVTRADRQLTGSTSPRPLRYLDSGSGESLPVERER